MFSELLKIPTSNSQPNDCKTKVREGKQINLGTFSVSLAVKNLETSRRFYEKLGFKVFAGDASQNWLILKNGDHAIDLFHGMFENRAELVE